MRVPRPLRLAVSLVAVGATLAGGAFSASAQVVIRERVEVAPADAAPRAPAASVEGAAVVGGSAWPGGVRGSGAVTVSGGLRLLGGDPTDLTLSVFTSRTRHDVDLGAATFSSNRTQCSTTYPAEGPAGDGVRGYALPDDLVTFRVGPAERLDSLVLTGAGVRVSTPHRIEPESAYQDNQWETDFPKRGCHWLFTRTLDRNNACGCVAGAPDQSDGAVALNWTFAPDPPAALAVSVGPDTLDYYGDGPAYYTGVVGAQSVYGDGTHAPYDGGELTYAAETPFGSLKWEACGRTTCGAPVRVPVATGAYGGRQKIRFVADGDLGDGQPRREDGPEYDAPVAVRVSGTLASGAGVTGAATVVVRGRAGPGPDSLAVTLADAEVPCGDSTRVTVRGVLGGEPRALPDTARVRLAVADSSRAVLSWGGVSGPSVEVPVGAVRDSAAVGVWVTTRGCAEAVDHIELRVHAEADAYWDVDGVVTGTGGATVPGRSGQPPALVVEFDQSALAPGQSAVVSVESAEPDVPLNDDDLVDLSLSDAAAEAGVLRLMSPTGATDTEGGRLSAIRVASVRSGRVVYTVNVLDVGRPPSGTSAMSSADSTAAARQARLSASSSSEAQTSPPYTSAPITRLASESVRVTAALTENPSISASSQVDVFPYGVRLEVDPDVVRVGSDITATVTVVSAVESPSAFVIPNVWNAVIAGTIGNVFLCAEDLVRESNSGDSAHPASFPILRYGRAEIGDAECAAFRTAGWSPLGSHTVTFRYQSPLGPSGAPGPFSPTIYGGLAVENSEGAWTWAAGPADGGGVRPLYATRQIQVLSPTGSGIAFEIGVSESEVWPSIPTHGACSSATGKCRGAYDFAAVDPTVDEVVVRLTQNGAPVEGVKVQIEAEWVVGSGGHSHDKSQNREPPRSKMGTFTLPNGRVSTASIEVVTNAAGEARAAYRAPEFGGQVVLRATGSYEGDALDDSSTVEVRVPGLELLPDRPDLYYRVGGTPDHHGPRQIGGNPVFQGDSDDNHHAIPAVNNKLAEIAEAWLAMSPSHTRIAINDLSLPNGGRFRVAPPAWGGSSHRAHQFHRVGRDADIKTSRGNVEGAIRLENGRNKDFEDVVHGLGGFAEIHGAGTGDEHYHIYFYGPLPPSP